jgi:hypothetical protein
VKRVKDTESSTESLMERGGASLYSLCQVQAYCTVTAQFCTGCCRKCDGEATIEGHRGQGRGEDPQNTAVQMQNCLFVLFCFVFYVKKTVTYPTMCVLLSLCVQSSKSGQSSMVTTLRGYFLKEQEHLRPESYIYCWAFLVHVILKVNPPNMTITFLKI